MPGDISRVHLQEETPQIDTSILDEDNLRIQMIEEQSALNFTLSKEAISHQFG